MLAISGSDGTPRHRMLHQTFNGRLHITSDTRLQCAGVFKSEVLAGTQQHSF